MRKIYWILVLIPILTVSSLIGYMMHSASMADFIGVPFASSEKVAIDKVRFDSLTPNTLLIDVTALESDQVDKKIVFTGAFFRNNAGEIVDSIDLGEVELLENAKTTLRVPVAVNLFRGEFTVVLVTATGGAYSSSPIYKPQ